MAKMNGNTGRLWLAMLREGGRSTRAEVVSLGIVQYEEANGMLISMVNAGSVQRYDPPPGAYGQRFGVTIDCKPPMGVTLRQILAAIEDSTETA